MYSYSREYFQNYSGLKDEWTGVGNVFFSFFFYYFIFFVRFFNFFLCFFCCSYLANQVGSFFVEIAFLDVWFYIVDKDLSNMGCLFLLSCWLPWSLTWDRSWWLPFWSLQWTGVKHEWIFCFTEEIEISPSLHFSSEQSILSPGVFIRCCRPSGIFSLIGFFFFLLKLFLNFVKIFILQFLSSFNDFVFFWACLIYCMDLTLIYRFPTKNPKMITNHPCLWVMIGWIRLFGLMMQDD